MSVPDGHPWRDLGRCLAATVRPPAVRVRQLERDGAPHNLIAHPLLVLCPPLGRFLHERTAPTVPTLYARRHAAHRSIDGWAPIRVLLPVRRLW